MLSLILNPRFFKIAPIAIKQHPSAIAGLSEAWTDLKPLKKTIYLFIVIYIALLMDEGIIIDELHFSFIDRVFYLREASIFFTLFCIFAFINAFNMFDGTNLQAGLYSLVITIFFSSKPQP